MFTYRTVTINKILRQLGANLSDKRVCLLQISTTDTEIDVLRELR